MPFPCYHLEDVVVAGDQACIDPNERRNDMPGLNLDDDR